MTEIAESVLDSFWAGVYAATTNFVVNFGINFYAEYKKQTASFSSRLEQDMKDSKGGNFWDHVKGIYKSARDVIVEPIKKVLSGLGNVIGIPLGGIADVVLASMSSALDAIDFMELIIAFVAGVLVAAVSGSQALAIVGIGAATLAYSLVYKVKEKLTK